MVMHIRQRKILPLLVKNGKLRLSNTCDFLKRAQRRALNTQNEPLRRGEAAVVDQGLYIPLITSRQTN